MTVHWRCPNQGGVKITSSYIRFKTSFLSFPPLVASLREPPASSTIELVRPPIASENVREHVSVNLRVYYYGK